MAALRRWKNYLSCLRSNSSVLFTVQKPAVQKVGKLRNVVFTSVASLTVGTTLCAIPFKQVDNLSHDSLIKRAASLVTDSSSTFLSQTTLALIEALTQYSKAVHTLIALQKRYFDSQGRLTPAEEDAIWQVIIGQRAQINDRKEECQRLDLTWASAVMLCEVAAEAALTSGAEQAGLTINTHIQVAHTQVKEVRKLVADADKLLTQTKVMEVERMAQNTSEEEEVPEAYLRED